MPCSSQCLRLHAFEERETETRDIQLACTALQVHCTGWSFLLVRPLPTLEYPPHVPAQDASLFILAKKLLT